MSKILHKAVTAQRRSDGRVPVKKMVSRGGRSFLQTYWVSPAQAKQMKERAAKDVKGVVKAGKAAFGEIKADRDFKKLVDKYEDNEFTNQLEVKLAAKWKDKTLSAKDLRDGYERIVDDAAETAIQYKPGWSGSSFGEVFDEAKRMFPAGRRQALVKQKAEQFLKDLKEVFPDGGIRPWKQQNIEFPARYPPDPFPERLDVDEVSMRELELYVENSADLYQQIRHPLEEAMAEDWRNNEFREKHMAREIMLKGLLNKGAMNYIREFNDNLLPGKQSPGYGRALLRASETMFPGPLRVQLARDIAREFTKGLEGGEYGAGGHRESLAKKVLGKKDRGEGTITIEKYARESIETAADDFDLSVKDLKDIYTAPAGYNFHLETADHTSDWDETELDIDGYIRTEDGTSVGSMHRVLRRDEEGDLHAEHKLLKIRKDFQKSGVGTAMVLNQFEQYEAMGVKTVSLDTAWVGKYLWMKLGFVPDEAEDARLREHIRHFIDNADIDDETKSVAYLTLDGSLNDFARHPGLPKVAYTDPEDRKTTKYEPINKAALLHNGTMQWSGKIEVGGDDWGNTMEILNGYVDKKAAKLAAENS